MAVLGRGAVSYERGTPVDRAADARAASGRWGSVWGYEGFGFVTGMWRSGAGAFSLKKFF